MSARARPLWVFAITSAALFMFSLDRLVVINTLPVIRADLHAGVEGLQWTMHAYTLTFAVLLLTGAALGDRFGRRRLLIVGLTIFTCGSAAAALAPSIEGLVTARAVQGVGGAILTPLTLTILTAAVPVRRRGLALGAWGGVGALGAGLGPLVGGALAEFLSWHWVFWLNVPLGLILIPLARHRLPESHGPGRRLDLVGAAIASVALFILVWGLVRGADQGWGSPQILIATGVGGIGLATFVGWELHAPAPMVPMRFFGNRAFAAANTASLLNYMALFGSLFLLPHLLQPGLGSPPLQAGVRLLPWAIVPILIIPVAGALSDRYGSRPLMALGLALNAAAFAWIATVAAPGLAYQRLVPALLLLGAGNGLFYAPVAAAALGAVRSAQHGQASGTTLAIRELAGVLGIAVLTSVFTARGGYASPTVFVAGFSPALWLGASLAALGLLPALALTRHEHAPTASRPCSNPPVQPGALPDDRSAAATQTAPDQVD